MTMKLQERLNAALARTCGKTFEQANKAELYAALMSAVREETAARPKISGERKLYYVSAECNISTSGVPHRQAAEQQPDQPRLV